VNNFRMRIKISTDSTADIPLSLREELGIAVIPITIIAGDREYRDGYDITPDEFYPIIDSSEKLPSSSQATPYMYTELFEQVWREGYTDLIHTSVNSKGSASCQNAVHMRDAFYEAHPEARGHFNIHIIDSQTYSMCYGWAVIQAARMAAEGADAEDIIRQIRDWLDNLRVIFVPLNLRCVKKSGRVSAAAAIVGGLVGVKPLITFENGDSKVIAKVRGTKKAIATLVEKCAAERRPGTPYIIARGNDLEQYGIFRDACKATLGEPALEFPLGCVISINTGPQVLGILYRV
jgi:DegV family protein with EDD domain